MIYGFSDVFKTIWKWEWCGLSLQHKPKSWSNLWFESNNGFKILFQFFGFQKGTIWSLSNVQFFHISLHEQAEIKWFFLHFIFCEVIHSHLLNWQNQQKWQTSNECTLFPTRTPPLFHSLSWRAVGLTFSIVIKWNWNRCYVLLQKRFFHYT